MNFKFLSIMLLTTALLAGCGETKPGSSGQGPNVQNATTAGDGPTLVADKPQDNNSTKKKKKHPVKPVAQAPTPLPAAPATLPPAEGTAPQISTSPAPVATQSPKSTAPYVVGMETQSKTSAQLFERGLQMAVSDASVCAAFGFIPNGSPGGSKCFLVYSDGSVKSADYYNRVEATTFVAKLKKDYETEQRAKKDKKASKKQKAEK